MVEKNCIVFEYLKMYFESIFVNLMVGVFVFDC